MAMENPLFIGDVPIEISISSGFLIATFDDRRVKQIDLRKQHISAHPSSTSHPWRTTPVSRSRGTWWPVASRPDHPLRHRPDDILGGWMPLAHGSQNCLPGISHSFLFKLSWLVYLCFRQGGTLEEHASFERKIQRSSCAESPGTPRPWATRFSIYCNSASFFSKYPSKIRTNLPLIKVDGRLRLSYLIELMLPSECLT